ncbi:ArfGap-domain-containing protein [Meira miltonrushii]|uniref:ArfGap-domain-containing protein n=1 Tax=Meira miltonrushii TaxID=1280837 RepID=A0A316VDW8_9BASI|nr:ArfGap-domain-containing protein [Meira miltonrushii]PWN35839.1 ArfGap-domain-containing protein [Meira miltonrushii]
MSSYARQTQSKAQTESNAKILRALVKQPDNKVCADCKRNDPRWASWNLGCFLCIRCSGIHRSMGTHISKVKSIDLDIWTPEQMTAIQSWGNRRANIYWEAHLKAGHVPPDHKVESFIRSKYELRRWAKEGPVPSDPSVLDGGAASANDAARAGSSTAKNGSSASKSAPSSNALDLLGGNDNTPAPAAATTSLSKPSASNNLLDDFSSPAVPATNRSTAAPKAAAASTTTAPAKAGTGGGGGLFDLDWHDGPSASASATSPVTSPGGTTKGKNDILSLFAASKPIAPTQPAQPAVNSGFGGLDSFGGLSMGSTNVQSPPQAAPPVVSDPWGASSGQNTNNNLFGSSDPWASSTTGSGATTTSNSNDIWGNPSNTTATNSFGTTNSTAGKNDAFADIWSDFK